MEDFLMSWFEINISLFRMINNLGKEYTALNAFFIFVAEYMVFLLALVMLAVWFARSNKERMMVICASVSFLMAEIVGKLAGKIHSNYQPFVELANVNKLIEKAIGNSFPSDHTILFFSFAMTIWFFQKKNGALWFTLAILVAFSRIWVGVHYPADVAAGATISMIAAAVVYHTVPKLSWMWKLLGIYERCQQYILSKPKPKESYYDIKN